MGVQVLFDSDNERACLLDTVTETVFGRAFAGMEAGEKLEGFLKWYAKNGAFHDVRVDPSIADVQDEWLAKLDDGCMICNASPWEPCDDIDGEHDRKFAKCAGKQLGGHPCPRPGRHVHGGKTWCASHLRQATLSKVSS